MDRFVYRKNPLIEVIAQYKFPKILALNSRDPVDFQEAIKTAFPIYQLALENQQEISIAINQDNTPVPSVVQRQPIKNHNFISQDGQYKINLTSGFISISTIGYTRWEDMLARFETPLRKFEELYSPSFYERIGLRYIDAFSRSKLKIEDKSWNELIVQPWLGAFSVIEEKKMINIGVDAEYLLDNDVSRAKIHTCIGHVNNDPESVFIIDSDFIHIQSITLSNTFEILNYLHDNAKVFVRSAITDTLHYAMEPEIVT